MEHNEYARGKQIKTTHDDNLENLINLEEGEKILLEVRRHMFILYGKVALLLVFFFVPLALAPGVSVVIDRITDNSYGNIVTGFFFLVWCLVLWVLFFTYWTDYYLDVWVITNKRIFDIEQRGIFRRDISVTRLEQIQDVTVSINGVFATFLHFGDIHIHTAGGEVHTTDSKLDMGFTIRNAANPMFVKDAIMKAHGSVVAVRGGQEH